MKTSFIYLSQIIKITMIYSKVSLVKLSGQRAKQFIIKWAKFQSNSISVVSEPFFGLKFEELLVQATCKATPAVTSTCLSVTTDINREIECQRTQCLIIIHIT